MLCQLPFAGSFSLTQFFLRDNRGEKVIKETGEKVTGEKVGEKRES